jgi:hypothetical protein
MTPVAIPDFRLILVSAKKAVANESAIEITQ